jgi:hypothetical protein
MYQLASAQDAGEEDALELRDRRGIPPSLLEKDRPCSDDRMKSPTSSHLKSRGSSPALTAAFKQAASES